MPVTWKLNLRDFSGNILTNRGHLAPMQLSWSKNLSQSGAVTCGISLRDDRYVTHDWISPYAQDWELRVHDGITYNDHLFMEGVVTSHEIDVEQELSMFGGQDYLHLFELRGYPFDPAAPTTFQTLWASTTDVGSIVHDLISTVFAQSNSQFSPTLNVSTALGIKQGFRIQYGDSSSLLMLIEQFAQGYPGFDHGFTTPKTYNIWYREYNEQHTSVYEFRESNVDGSIPGVSGIKWANAGPSGTHASGIGAGTATQFWQNYGYIPSQLQYRRMDISPSFGDIMNRSHLQRATAGALGIALAPRYELTLVVDPDFVITANGFYNDFQPGAYFFIRKDIKGHLLDGKYKIVQMQGSVSDEGQDLVTLSCNRETDLSLVFSDTTP